MVQPRIHTACVHDLTGPPSYAWYVVGPDIIVRHMAQREKQKNLVQMSEEIVLCNDPVLQMKITNKTENAICP